MLFFISQVGYHHNHSWEYLEEPPVPYVKFLLDPTYMYIAGVFLISKETYKVFFTYPINWFLHYAFIKMSHLHTTTIQILAHNNYRYSHTTTTDTRTHQFGG